MNKRFTAHTDGLRCPKHYYIKYDDEIVFQLNLDEIPQGFSTLNKICDLLNALSEQNDELKQQIKHIQGTIAIINGCLQNDGVLTFEKYREIEDYQYNQWQGVVE